MTSFEQFIDRELVRHCETPCTLEIWQLDGLLELRCFVSMVDQLEPNLVVKRFFQFKVKMEQEHYLLFYRLRDWLVHRYQLVIEDPLQRCSQQVEPIELTANSFKQMLGIAKSRYFETADQLIPINDLRCRIEFAE